MKDDSFYIRMVLNGENDYFSFLVEKYQSLLFNTIKKIVENRAVAEDIAQDTFFKAYKSLKNFNLDKPFYPYLVRIAINCTKDYFKKEKREVSLQSEVMSEASHNDFDRISEMYELIYSLPDTFREVILCFYRDGKNIKEIALETGDSVENVKVKLFRARKLLLKFSENL